MEKSLEKKTEISIGELADALEKMQAGKNNGRGVTVIRSVVTYLRAGSILEAKVIASHDHDKIRNYPDIEKYLKENLFKGVELWRWTSDLDKED